MNKLTGKLIIVLILLVLVSPGLAKIPALFVAPGGTLESFTSSYRLMDIKGQALVGKTSGGGISLEAGGTAFWRGEEAPPGTVRLSIERAADARGSAVRVRWASTRVPDIYMASSYPGADWTRIVDGTAVPPSVISADFSPSSPTEYIDHRNQVGTGISQVYYKGLIAGNDMATFLSSAEAVGKFNWTCAQGFNLVSLPFRSFGTTEVAAVVGTQLPSALSTEPSNNIYNYEEAAGASYKASYISSAWSFTSPFRLNLSKGYWVEVNKPQSPEPTIVTVVGAVNEEASRSIIRGFNLLGSPLAASREVEAARFTAGTPGAFSGTAVDPGDQIYVYDPSATAVLTDGRFAFSSPFSLRVGRGFWYEAKKGGPYTPYNWTIR